MVICTIIRILPGICLRITDTKKFEKAVTKVSATHMTRVTCKDDVTANAEHPFRRVDALFKDARLRLRKQTCYEDESALVFHIIAMGAKTNHNRLRMDLAKSSDYTLNRS